MTYAEALQIIIRGIYDTDICVRAAQIARRMERGDRQLAEKQARRIITDALHLGGDFSEDEVRELQQLTVEPQGSRKTVRFEFRCTEQERATIGLLAAKYAGGNVSRLILQTLQERYPTLFTVPDYC